MWVWCHGSVYCGVGYGGWCVGHAISFTKALCTLCTLFQNSFVFGLLALLQLKRGPYSAVQLFEVLHVPASCCHVRAGVCEERVRIRCSSRSLSSRRAQIRGVDIDSLRVRWKILPSRGVSRVCSFVCHSAIPLKTFERWRQRLQRY